jgi:GNAT superfamily N-acetyltransferase
MMVASPLPDQQPDALADAEATASWLATQTGLLKDYAGQWVAMADRQIVAHDRSFLAALEQARDRGHDDPLMVPVRRPHRAIDRRCVRSRSVSKSVTTPRCPVRFLNLD